MILGKGQLAPSRHTYTGESQHRKTYQPLHVAAKLYLQQGRFTELHMAAHVNEFIGGCINGVKIPLQNFCLKEGGGLIFEMGVLSWIYGMLYTMLPVLSCLL